MNIEFVFILAVEGTQVLDSIAWVRCASGNVFSSNIGHQVEILELIANWATKWHILHWIKNWSSGWGAMKSILINMKFLLVPHCLLPDTAPE